MPTKSNNGTFTSRVQHVVKSIRPGQTKSYKEVATLAGNPRAARAVARIMAANYDPAIPCHRVIKSDGTLGGYNRGGILKKQEILAAENAHKK
jgi:methylated-DNA-[protein]-cysteine S-methyltransferase